MTKKANGTFILNIVLIVSLAAALILSVVSSNTAYALTHLPEILIAGIAGIVICVCLLLFDGKIGSPVVKDAGYLITVAATAFALTTMIAGRVLLMGYVYFSDLESNNPVAVSAMNIAIAAWVCFLIALIAGIGIGFTRKDR